jgi:hypothetical protein
VGDDQRVESAAGWDSEYADNSGWSIRFAPEAAIQKI